MTAGRGISHSEVSTPETTTLHGVQLWVALPEATRDGDPGLEHHVPEPVAGSGWEARVLVGSLLGSTSPVRTHSPLVGAEVRLAGGGSLDVPLDPAFEYAVLLDTGDVALSGDQLAEAELGYLPPGGSTLRLTSVAGARLMLLGGEPLGEQIVMWWNFIGRTDAEVRAHRAAWQEQLDPAVPGGVRAGRYGVVAGGLPPIPAPPLPHATLRPRA